MSLIEELYPPISSAQKEKDFRELHRDNAIN